MNPQMRFSDYDPTKDYEDGSVVFKPYGKNSGLYGVKFSGENVRTSQAPIESLTFPVPASSPWIVFALGVRRAALAVLVAMLAIQCSAFNDSQFVLQQASQFPSIPPVPKRVPDASPLHAVKVQIVPGIDDGSLTSFAWCAPTNLDGSVCTNIAGYELFWGTYEGHPYLGPIFLPGTETNADIPITNFDLTATNYFVIASYDTSGQLSDFTKTIVAWPPHGPRQTNIVVSWPPQFTDVLVESSTDIKNWQVEGSYLGTNAAVFTVTNHLMQFFRASANGNTVPLHSVLQ